MAQVKTAFWYKAILIGLLCAVVMFYGPFAVQLKINREWLSQFTEQNDSVLVPAIRSFGFASGCSLLIVCLSLLCSFYLQQVSLKKPISSWLGLLLMPVVLGNLSTAFIWKLLLLDNHIQDYLLKFLLLTLIQFWQFGSLFIYLFWLNQQNIPGQEVNYQSTMKLTFFERIRDTLLPRQKNILVLVYLLSFIFCFYEDAKVELIFKASRGTHTELVNQWLNRNYQSDSLINPGFAFSQITRSGVSVMILGLLGLVTTMAILLWGYRRILKINSSIYRGDRQSFNARMLVYILAAASVLPVIAVYFRQLGHYTFDVFSLSYPMLLTLAAAFLATFVSVAFAIMVRLVWPEVMGSFNRRSVMVILGLMSMQFIPELLALICGFKWMQLIGYASGNNITMAWVCAHIILSFPILSSFSIVMHFSVNNQQLYYLEAHRLSVWEKINDIFLRPLLIQYLLIFILAFSTIWNEAVINNILSDSIPSFATELNNAISGKGADYSHGMLYLLVSLLLALISFLLWDQIIRQARKKLNTTS